MALEFGLIEIDSKMFNETMQTIEETLFANRKTKEKKAPSN
jgi:hypothetical protein